MLNQTLANRYTLTAHIGSGAMGTVYRATDSHTGDEVAVKVLNRELAFSPELLERFRREGEALRQLRHPNIVGLVDAFQHNPDPSGGAGGQQVIVMEYVAGGSLHGLIKQGPLPVDHARKIALGLCDALTRAHDLGIIHRDIKPENILVAADGTPKLTDFGIARLLTEGTQITHSGVQVGTPYYMSPEAWEGKPLDAQADVWSLGVVLYEMLAGEVPFPGDTVIAVMHKVLTAPLPELKQVRPDAPDGLAQIVRRMMTRNKTARYQTMREVGLDLERGSPLVIPAAVPAPPAKPAKRAPRWAWGAVAGIVLLIGIVVGGRVWEQRVTPESQAALALASPVSSTATASRTPRPSITPRLRATPAPTMEATPCRNPFPLSAPGSTQVAAADTMIAQSRAFVEPIIAMIAGNCPDFSDDFSTANEGWNSGFGLHGKEGTFAIEDGVARFRLGQADAQTNHGALNQKDFVLQVDARLAAGDKASLMQVSFHGLSSDYWFNLNLYSELRAWDVTKMWGGQFQQVAKGEGSVSPIGETTQVMIVTRGTRAAIYLNGTPVTYFENADFDTVGQTLLMCTSISQTICEFDNVKFWNLDNVPGLP